MKILTFDIEDWFHILDNSATQNEENWKDFPSRLNVGMDIIHETIEKTNQSATFFVLGWIAEKYPNIVRKIKDLGYEVGSHSHMHQLAYNQNRDSFKQDIERSVKTLEDCVSKKITSFRAPGFSITNQNKWAFEILAELGIETDCSVFPAARAHGGIPQYGLAKPSILSYNGIKLREFPINTVNIFGKPMVFSGGGYFRLFPYAKIKSWTQKSDYVMTYFHPRDFDFNQPLIPGLSLSRRFKSYVGLKNCQNKLKQWLIDFDFMDLNSAKSLINWDEVPQIKL